MVTINFTLSDNLNLSYDGYRTNDYVFTTAANAATIEVRLKVNSGEGSLYLDNVEVNYSATSNRASSLLKSSRKGYLLFLLDRVIYYGIVLAMRPVVQQANPGVPPVYITASYAASEQFFR